MKMLMHLVEKVGKALAPLIILINQCEKPYCKKVPKAEKQYEPKRMKKKIYKMMSRFKPGDQALLIGITDQPWMCPAKNFKRDYQKVIYIPKPEYGSRMEIWRHLLVPHGQYIHEDVHFSLLNKLSDNFTVGTIRKVVNTLVGNHKKILEKEEKDKLDREEDTWSIMENGGKTVKLGKSYIMMDQFLDELSNNYDPIFIEVCMYV
jgi:SpoVK/Ycf46/Vps4 family AAA+-type ATPase